jgi:hypothetical protein
MICLKFLDFIKESYDNATVLKTNDYFKTRKNAHTFGLKLFKNWYNNLTDFEKEIIEWYRGNGHEQIAKYLFNLNLDITYDELSTKEVIEYIKKLEHILNSSKIKKDVVVYKGVRKGKLLDLISNLEIGDTFKFDNFISTTLHFQYAICGFTAIYGLKKVVMKIKIHHVYMFLKMNVKLNYLSIGIPR